jgi:hypothetical protein
VEETTGETSDADVVAEEASADAATTDDAAKV